MTVMGTDGGPWRMPHERDRHDRTWMAWPSAAYTLGDTDAKADAARATWAAVARAVAAFEPVTMVTAPGDEPVARRWCDDGGPARFEITILTAALDDAWMRDIGPTFVLSADGVLGAVDWIFNGWGGQSWARWDNDALVAALLAGEAGAVRVPATIVNEGGGIHTDGAGTVLLTETVQLDPGRNPGATRARIEAELGRTIGAHSFIWLPRGLTRDYDEFGTRGHVDIVAAFSEPGTVLLHWQDDPAHPDHAVSRQVERVLEAVRDARGQPLSVVRVPAPRTLRDADGPVDWSYLNHYVCNGAVIAGTFDDPHDDRALAILAGAYPGRRVVGVDARALFARGGGIHCITQQQPARGPTPIDGGQR